jgi:hypothetical protein
MTVAQLLKKVSNDFAEKYLWQNLVFEFARGRWVYMETDNEFPGHTHTCVQWLTDDDTPHRFIDQELRNAAILERETINWIFDPADLFGIDK